ncbi:MAG: hypothetical protein EAZ85_09985 [Bacteroidetes bacterium]|nr:MAG: hypothetical protein EAZ85_09985 [Bacteroidota bacterium]TAG95862.1 MAG: hypothetical protein EAZ20_00050 [Bacteroidota bacterium]
MDILIYNEIEYGKLKKQFDKTLDYLKTNDFKSADVKKMVNTGFYRAKLDDTNRLLFKYTRIEGKTFLLLLEIIFNHDYDKSRFLNGAIVDESKLISIKTEKDFTEEESTPLAYINQKQKSFHILDKILSFDEIQDEIFRLPSPVIIIGSAGSGKTALTLEKIKTLSGKVLYTTLSNYLVENSKNIYYSYDYENEKQEVDFMSFQEYLSSIEVPTGKEIDFRTFEQWIWRFKQSHKIKDAYKIYEEFKGVMTGSIVDKPYLSKEEYLNLGVKQSIFLQEERELVYDVFKKYIDFLQEGKYYDSNLVAFGHLSKIEKSYDFVVIDEVQDITNVQLFSIIKSLKIPTNFILCGDSNQIVHPNFFSWANIKTLFYKQELKGNIIRVLSTNYRNTPEVTGIANQLLLIKNARFGSIDKESNYLVKSNSQHKGEVQFLENLPKTKQELNQKTKKSAKFAVIVMRNEDKDEARKYFQTPLLFSIHEVKGLEYENIILYNIISGYEKEFRELTSGVSKEQLQAESLVYARAKDKTDKSLDEYKFYVNALYVAMTRAIKNLYVVETNKKHALLELLNLTNFSSQVNLKEQNSSAEEWQREANRLEKQGKNEQADAIRNQVLQIKPVPWEVITAEKIKDAMSKGFLPDFFNKKSKDILYEYALYYGDGDIMKKLSALKYRPADEDRWTKERTLILARKFHPYVKDDLKAIEPLFQRHGLDFRNEVNLTPFMLALTNNSPKILEYLIKNGAKKDLVDNNRKNATHLLFLQTYLKDKKDNLNQVYHLVKNESLRLKIKNKFIKIDNHQAEYFMLTYMLSILGSFLNNPIKKEKSMYSLLVGTFEASVFLNFYEGLTHHTIPEYRTKRSYISSILSKNEVRADNPYNKKLWVRLELGNYILNPLLEILIENEWVNIYDWVNLDDMVANNKERLKKINYYDIRNNKNEKGKEMLFQQIAHYKNLLLNSNDILPDEDEQTKETKTTKKTTKKK